LRFVILSDTHYYTNGHGKCGIFWNRPLIDEMSLIASDMVFCINRIHPDFVIHCGDFIDRCHPDNYDYAWDILGRIHCPVYLVPGNHDTLDDYGRREISRHYGLPEGRCYYSRQIEDCFFIFLDTSYWLKSDGTFLSFRDQTLYEAKQLKGLAIPDEEIDWLEKELEANRDKKIFVVTHAPLSAKHSYPAATLPNGDCADCDGTDVSELMDLLGVGLYNADKVLELLKRYNNVKMVLSGHWHINDVFDENGIVFCQTGSMREYPYEFRVAEEKAGLLSIHTMGLDNKKYAEESYCEDRGNRWVSGSEEDRTFVVGWENDARKNEVFK